MKHYEVGFIGAGNMGGALAAAACKRVDPERVIIADRYEYEVFVGQEQI